MQITWGPLEFVHVMPVEVAGWLLRSIETCPACWVMVLSKNVTLAAALVMRAPVELNVVLGAADIANTGPGMESLRSRAEDHLVPNILDANALTPVNYTREQASAGGAQVFCDGKLNGNGGQSHSRLQRKTILSHSRIPPFLFSCALPFPGASHVRRQILAHFAMDVTGKAYKWGEPSATEAESLPPTQHEVEEPEAKRGRSESLARSEAGSTASGSAKPSAKKQSGLSSLQRRLK